MNKTLIALYAVLCFITFLPTKSTGQAMHFSQYYNAPLLLNPANTALTQEADYRIGAQFRTQWAALPAPFTTTSVFGDFQAFRNKNQTNWLGVGFAFFNDNVGDGKLNLFRSEMFLAYHIEIGEFNMISFGASASHGARSVNFSKFTYPVQWDGFTFNKNDPNQENKGLEKSSYNSFGAGLNYAYFPNDAVYIKLGASTNNLNRPTESFFKGGTNTLDFRHQANLDILLRTSENTIINPSAYYTTQSGAREILFGTLLLFNVTKATQQVQANQLITGLYNRWGDAVVAVAGMQLNSWRIMASYDYTISSLPVNAGKGTGALEMSVRYEGLYNETSRGRRMYHCPRF